MLHIAKGQVYSREFLKDKNFLFYLFCSRNLVINETMQQILSLSLSLSTHRLPVLLLLMQSLQLMKNCNNNKIELSFVAFQLEMIELKNIFIYAFKSLFIDE